MRGNLFLEKKILFDLKDLSPDRVSEVAHFVEYLKTQQRDWKDRFKSFLKRIEPKMNKISYSGIAGEIARTRKG